MLTDASRYGKRRKYTLKDINVEQEAAEVTNRQDKNWHLGEMQSLVDLRNRTGEERRRQTLCDKRDNNFV